MCLDQARFAGQALRVHNYFRRIHNSLPLKINEDLVRQALDAAKASCTKAKRSEINDNKGIGETVGSACNFASQRVSAAEAVTNWYVVVTLFQVIHRNIVFQSYHSLGGFWVDQVANRVVKPCLQYSYKPRLSLFCCVNAASLYTI